LSEESDEDVSVDWRAKQIWFTVLKKYQKRRPLLVMRFRS
jgi:hypothetical protein